MFEVNLAELVKNNKDILKSYKLDDASIKKFRKDILKVKPTKALELGEKLFATLNKKKLSNDDAKNITELIKAGADVNYQEPDKGNFPLLVCANKGLLTNFTELIQAGANINLANKDGTTTLMRAANRNYHKIVEILIALKVDINARCLDGDAAITSAVRHGSLESFELLVDAGAYLNITTIFNEDLLQICENEKLLLIASKLNAFLSKSTEKTGYAKEQAIELLIEAKDELLKYQSTHDNSHIKDEEPTIVNQLQPFLKKKI